MSAREGPGSKAAGRPPPHSFNDLGRWEWVRIGSKGLNSAHRKRRIQVGFGDMKGNKPENASLLDISMLDHTPYNR